MLGGAIKAGLYVGCTDALVLTRALQRFRGWTLLPQTDEVMRMSGYADSDRITWSRGWRRRGRPPGRKRPR